MNDNLHNWAPRPGPYHVSSILSYLLGLESGYDRAGHAFDELPHYTYDWLRDDQQKMLSFDILLPGPTSIRNIIEISSATIEEDTCDEENFLFVCISPPRDGPFLAYERGPVLTIDRNDNIVPGGMYQMSDSRVEARQASLDEVKEKLLEEQSFNIPIKKRVHKTPTFYIGIYEDPTVGERHPTLPTQHVWVLHVDMVVVEEQVKKEVEEEDNEQV